MHNFLFNAISQLVCVVSFLNASFLKSLRLQKACFLRYAQLTAA